MRKKSVAVLDIRSSEITAAVGERGVNNTFIIKSNTPVPMTVTPKASLSTKTAL